MDKVLLSYNMDTTRPGRPLWARFLRSTLCLEAHSPTSERAWEVHDIRTAGDLWDAIIQATREHAAAQKEGT